MSILTVEQLGMQSYYTTIINGLKLSDANPLDYVELKDKIARDIQIVQVQKIKADNYVEFLNATAETHNELYEGFLGKNKSKISPSELTEICQDFFTIPPEEQAKNSKANLKREDIRNARKVLLNYKANIQPLFIDK